MIRQIFKFLWAHRLRSLGLFIELVIVTIIGWIVIEPMAVKTSRALIPAGFEYDRIVTVKLSSLDGKSAEYDSLANADGAQVSAIRTLLRNLSARNGVESATPICHTVFDHSNLSMSSYKFDKSLVDTTHDDRINAIVVHYVPGTHFFETYGLKSPSGTPFEEPKFMPHTKIVSSNLARALYPGQNPVGKPVIIDRDDDDSETPTLISGVVADATYSKGRGRTPIQYVPYELGEDDYSIYGFALRLGEGVNPYAFVDRLNADLPDYRVGNFYLTEPSTYADLRATVFADTHRELLKGWIVAIFFLVNVLLGVAGTFYIQTRTRIPDAGVMRAFGATRLRIEASIVGEAAMMVFLGWAVGSIIYIAYMHFTDYSTVAMTENWIATVLSPMWYDTLPSRLAVVGISILLLLLAMGALGAWLPARRVGRVSPVDALREE